MIRFNPPEHHYLVAVASERWPASHRNRRKRQPHHASPWEFMPSAVCHGVRSQFTRVIHLLLLLVVVHQLVGSAFMQRPFPGDPPAWPFVLHEYLGLGSVAILTTFWIWVLFRRGETRLARLFPWFSRARLRDVLGDLAMQLQRMARCQAPHDDDGALASGIHGLGLVTVTVMATTGFVFFFAQGTPVAHLSLELHKLIANLMWAYLIGHAGLACLHHLLGSDILSRMFWIRRRSGAANDTMR